MISLSRVENVGLCSRMLPVLDLPDFLHCAKRNTAKENTSNIPI